MGQKVHPKSFRLGYLYTWHSKWFAKKNYGVWFKEDVKIKEALLKKLKEAAVSHIDIERSPQEIVVNIFSSRPGLIIGRGGGGIEELKKKIVALLSSAKTQVKINIQEVKQPLLDAKLASILAAEQIEKRIPFRRVLKQMIQKVMEAGAEGVKVMVAGRLDGSEMSRREWVGDGKIPLQTLRADIDFARTTAYTTYGVIGVKVWIYRGEIFVKSKGKTEIAKEPAKQK